ncbi:MAG: hypothetical protein JNK84_14145 [Phreatobacter sp.]|uniref:hypothetical protein n=1 Tax=Phreatobacter sp. TaxID=1966341 RepID=UPI001A61D517|nr:hypothetical protein [Phreatobacter sp.]MBL8570207.1 hypothetical protein [Phreatobacter sp.]
MSTKSRRDETRGLNEAGKQLFGDGALRAATELDERRVRLLIEWGAVRPTIGGKGVVRQWARSTVLRMSRIAAVHALGLGLRVSHTVIAMCPADADAEYLVDEASDAILTIREGTLMTFSAPWTGHAPVLFGRLNHDRSKLLSANAIDLAAPLPFDLGSLVLTPVSKREHSAWRNYQVPGISVTTVNLSRACRVSVDRLKAIGHAD